MDRFSKMSVEEVLDYIDAAIPLALLISPKEVGAISGRYMSGAHGLSLSDVARTLDILIKADIGPLPYEQEQVARQIRDQHQGYVDVWRHLRIAQELSV